MLFCFSSLSTWCDSNILSPVSSVFWSPTGGETIWPFSCSMLRHVHQLIANCWEGAGYLQRPHRSFIAGNICPLRLGNDTDEQRAGRRFRASRCSGEAQLLVIALCGFISIEAVPFHILVDMWSSCRCKTNDYCRFKTLQDSANRAASTLRSNLNSDSEFGQCLLHFCTFQLFFGTKMFFSWFIQRSGV